MSTKFTISYKLRSTDMSVQDLTREEAVEIACHLLDDGHRISGIVSGSGDRPLKMVDLAGIHAAWLKSRPANLRRVTNLQAIPVWQHATLTGRGA